MRLHCAALAGSGMLAVIVSGGPCAAQEGELLGNAGAAEGAPLVAPAVAGVHGLAGGLSDLRFSLGMSPANYQIRGEEAEAESPLTLSLHYLRSFGHPDSVTGWIYGSELSFSRTSDDRPDIPLIVSYGLSAMAGYAYSLASRPQVHLEATPYLGIGMFKVDGGGCHCKMVGLNYGIRVAAIYTFNGGWQVGADLRYAGTAAGDLDNSGFAYAIGAGYRF